MERSHKRHNRLGILSCKEDLHVRRPTGRRPVVRTRENTPRLNDREPGVQLALGRTPESNLNPGLNKRPHQALSLGGLGAVAQNPEGDTPIQRPAQGVQHQTVGELVDDGPPGQSPRAGPAGVECSEPGQKESPPACIRPRSAPPGADPRNVCQEFVAGPSTRELKTSLVLPTIINVYATPPQASRSARRRRRQVSGVQRIRTRSGGTTATANDPPPIQTPRPVIPCAAWSTIPPRYRIWVSHSRISLVDLTPGGRT